MEEGKKRLATLVGCNYAGIVGFELDELKGCINDVVAMREVLISRFGFEPHNIKLLTDEAGSPVKPTGANIKRVLREMIDQAEDGDVLYFHFSGHGMLTPNTDHPSQKDEAIVPWDSNLITSVDFRALVNQLPSGASFTILSDSCHSGGLIDKEKEQIGQSTASTTLTSRRHKPRFIPYETVLQHLTSITGIDSSDIGTHLCHAFGDEVSIKYRSSEAQEHHVLSSVKADAGILLSGCQANEKSADIPASEEGVKACGAFSNAIQTVLKSHEKPLSNREIVTKARKLLHEGGFEQHPCLYSSDENADAPFLWQPKY